MLQKIRNALQERYPWSEEQSQEQDAGRPWLALINGNKTHVISSCALGDLSFQNEVGIDYYSLLRELNSPTISYPCILATGKEGDANNFIARYVHNEQHQNDYCKSMAIAALCFEISNRFPTFTHYEGLCE